MADDASEGEGWVAVGKVLKPRGIRGEAWLSPLTDYPERFDDLDEVRVQKPDGTSGSLRIGFVRSYGKRLGIKFAGVASPEAVAEYRGSLLMIPRDKVYPLPEDRYYVFEIVGLKVETEAGEAAGEVVDVLSLPGNDVYVVDRDGQEVLLPAAADLLTVELEAGRIVVKDLEGLL